MSQLNIGKVSGLMTGRERAKLVIALQLKGLNELPIEEVKKYEEGLIDKKPVIPTQAEIKQIVASCPDDQGSEYNFYINLKQIIWTDIEDKIRDNIIKLEFLYSDISKLSYLISISPIIYSSLQELERMPVVVTKEQYDEGVVQAKEFERNSTLPLEGRYNLAEQEAYERLIKEGKIVRGDLDSYLDFIDNFGKSPELLLGEKVKQIREQVADYKKQKEILEGEEPVFKYFGKYADLSEEELRERAKQDFSAELLLPSQEEYDLWQKTVQEERARLLGVVQQGTLKSQDQGIHAGSYYDWNGRYQKFAGEEGGIGGWNPMNEDCLEMGYSDGKVTSSIQALESKDWHQIVVSTSFNKNVPGIFTPDAIQNRVEMVLRLLKVLTPFEVASQDNKTKEIILKFSRPEYEEKITNFVTQAQTVINRTYEYLSLIEEVEEKYFDGMKLSNIGLDKPDFSPEKVQMSIDEIIERHNGNMQDVIKLFARTSFGLWNFKIDGLTRYLLTREVKPDIEWISLQLKRLELEAKK